MADPYLPPGVSDWMIPGNRPEDIAWEEFFEYIGNNPITAEEAREIWDLGMEEWKREINHEN